MKASSIALLSLLSLTVKASSQININVSDFEQYWWEQPVDHYNYQDTRTYLQRFWVNDKYWKQSEGAPVFIYICGEYECSVPDTRLFPFMVGADYDARLMVIEHRFYGESQPFDSWETTNLRYLSSEQALSDLAFFIDQQNSYWGDRQWIVVGGSYPGALSAWFRQRYPHLAVASWSSSGVVQPIVDFDQFDYQIFTSTSKSGSFCPTFIQNITAEVDQMFQSSNYQELQALFNAEGMRYDDFMFFFADIFVESVQYGSRTQLCDLILNISSLDTWSQLKAIKALADEKGVSPGDYCSNSLQNTTIVAASSGRCWTYQYCTEFGFFQIPNQVQPMRSPVLNSTYWYEYCQRIFPEIAHLIPNLNQTVSEFGGVGIQGSNTYFVNGVEDPWRWAGLQESSLPYQKTAVANCTDCGHCVELYTPKSTDPVEVQEIRSDIKVWVRQILETQKQAKKRRINFNQEESSGDDLFLQF